MTKFLLHILLLVGLLLATPAWADFKAGLDAYNRGDYETALAEFRPLEEQGHAKAQLNLGDMYRFGWGVPQDYKEAAKWYRLAAEQGNAGAQHNLGIMYDKGQGVAAGLSGSRSLVSLGSGAGVCDCPVQPRRDVL